jgi:hypothetical protein
MDPQDAACNVAEDFRGGARALAVTLDMNPFTFMHQLAEDGTAKLGLRTAVKMTKRTGDLRILNAFASECGCLVLRLPESLAVEGDEAMQLVAGVTGEFNDVVQAFVASMSDLKISDNEMSNIRRQWGELVAVGQRLVAHAEAVHQATVDNRGPLRVAGR